MAMNEVAVVGRGRWGSGIAQICAQAGLHVRLYDVKDEFVQTGLRRIEQFLKKSIERNKMTENESVEVLRRIKGNGQVGRGCSISGLGHRGYPEDMKLKKEFFKGLLGKCKESAIWASNTSTLSITEMASVTIVRINSSACIFLIRFN